jgi:hypothetical protein
VNPEEHALVYAGKDDSTEPKLLDGEEIDKKAIRMEPEHGVKLHPASRINFGKLYTVEHSAKVVPLGKIAKRLMPLFLAYYHEVRKNRQKGTYSDDDDDDNDDDEDDDDESDEDDEDEQDQYRSSPPPYDR